MPVIELKVHRSSARNARMAFIITAITVFLVALVVAKIYVHPILAVFIAAPIATAIGGIAWTLVRIWPVIRLLWWWTPEIGLIIATAWAWTALASNTAAWLTALVLAVVIGVPALVAPIRRRLVAIAWCVIVRHRLRVCFSQFIVANKSGSLPLIGLAVPTPVGERVWVMLRPGLSLSYLQGQLDKIAVACHASSAVVEQTNRNGSSARVRFDIKRREVLTAVVSGLDLPDVTDEPTPVAATAAAKSSARANGRKPTTTPAASAAVDDGDDITDWI